MSAALGATLVSCWGAGWVTAVSTFASDFICVSSFFGFLLELLDAPRFHRELGGLLVVARDGQRALGAAVKIGVAAAVEVVLGERVGLQRPGQRFGIDQHHFERRRTVVEPGRIRRADGHAKQDDGVQYDRRQYRVLKA